MVAIFIVNVNVLRPVGGWGTPNTFLVVDIGMNLFFLFMLDTGMNYDYNTGRRRLVGRVGSLLRVRKMIDLGSVFVDNNETFWGVFDFHELTLMVTLVKLRDKQLNDWCMYQDEGRDSREIKCVHLSHFASNELMLIKDAYYDSKF
jgi:hypothetical protein